MSETTGSFAAVYLRAYNQTRPHDLLYNDRNITENVCSCPSADAFKRANNEMHRRIIKFAMTVNIVETAKG